jgi:hypothetical protein
MFGIRRRRGYHEDMVYSFPVTTALGAPILLSNN